MASSIARVAVNDLFVCAYSVGIIAKGDSCALVVAPRLKLSTLPCEGVAAYRQRVAYGVIGYGR